MPLEEQEIKSVESSKTAYLTKFVLQVQKDHSGN